MSIAKYYNSERKQWETIMSLVANHVKVLDVNGNYDSQSVEGCLQEIADTLSKKVDDITFTADGKLNFFSNGVKIKSITVPVGSGGSVDPDVLKDFEERLSWLEENGGGGGGTSNNTAPTISSTFTKTSFSTDEEIEIPYFIMDNQGGNFKAHCTIMDGKTGVVVAESVDAAILGPNTWNVGKLAKGSYILKIYIKDFSLFSNELSFNVTVGSLEITSSFRDKDYGLNEAVTITYDIESVTSDAIQVERILDGVVETVSASAGRSTWSLGVINKGVHTVQIKAFTEHATSNVLNYTFTVTDSESLYVSSTLDPNAVWNIQDRLIIPFRVSLIGGSKFTAHYKLNGVEQPTAECSLGMNFWDLGFASIGIYDLEIYVTNKAGTITSNTLTFKISVEATDFTPVSPVEDYLLCWFDARGKSNDYSNREEWTDRSGNNVKATLIDVNYSNNGWIDDGLRLNGDAYVEIDLKPFLNGVTNYGLTLDVQYIYNNVGNDDARIFSCESPLVPYQGCCVNSDVSRAYGSESINETSNNEGNKIRATFVFDPAEGRTYIYINGVICNSALLSVTEQFVHDSKIYLNCQKNRNGEVINLSDCTIYNVRVYEKALTHEEVVQNHISDMEYEEQKEAVRRNTFSSLGKMDMDGNFAGMGAEDQVPLRVAFSPNDGPGVKFDYPACMVDWQGNSSLQYAIKNYNIDVFDETGSGIEMVMNEGWPSQDEYHMKANMVDSSHAFNLGIAKLLPKVYTEGIPPMIEDPDGNYMYAVDGFPITMFHNGNFHGIYTFNLKQRRHLFGMSKSNPLHFMYRAEENSANGAAAFRDSSDYSIEQEWEERHPKREPGTGADHSAFKRVIDFVKNSTDADFKKNIKQYFNFNYLLDYYLVCYAFGGIDSLGKNLTMATWDAKIWYLMFYDMDTFFGFDNKGELVWGPEVRCPEDYNTSGSLLWEKVFRCFQAEIRERYATLRRGGLNLETVLDTIEGEVIGNIGETFYNRDNMDKYLSQGAAYLYMAKGNRVQHLRRWLTARFLYTDSMFGYLPDVENTVILRNTMSGLWTIRLKTYTPQLITIEFGGTGVGGVEPYLGTLTKQCNNKEWTEFSYFFDGVYQRDISISGAKYIMDIDGLNNCELLMLDVRYCEKLLNISANKNPNLTSINLSNCHRLQTLDLSNCTKLGSTTGTSLDVGNCYNLKHLDVSNTSIPAITTTNCSYLKYVDISNSLVASINYSNLQSLKTVNISNCSRLSEVSINSCQGITELSITNDPSLRTIRIENCKSLQTININKVSDLENLIIEECPNLATIKIRTAPVLTALDVSGCEGLVTLDVQAVPLSDISFGEIAKLKYIDISKNTSIRKLDFSECKSIIETLNITNTDNIREILNMDMLVASFEQTQLFKGNDYLQRITGQIRFGDGITYARNMFQDCTDLEEVPSMTFNQVTNISGMFMNCVNLVEVPELDTSKMTDLSYLFYNCERLESAPDLDTSKCVNFNYMFYNCNRFTSTPSYDLSSATATNGMFKQCSNIITVRSMNTSNITNFSEMFMDCSSIEYLPNFNTSKATNLYYFLDGCLNLKALPSLDTSKVENFSRAFSRCENILEVASLDTSSATNMSYMFYGNTNLISICDLDMGKALDISGMLEGCYNLTDIPSFNTGNVTNFSYLFGNCYKITSVPQLDTKSAINISGMYLNCSQLVDIPPINTTNVTRMNELFYSCSSLTDVPEFITDGEGAATKNVIEMRSLFNGCHKLTTVPELDTSNVTDFSEMFSSCSKLESIPDLDVTKARLTNEMFSGCSSLSVAPKLITTDEKTPCHNVTIMHSMFRGCTNLPEIPEFSTENAENVSYLFEGCATITEVPELDVSKAIYVNSMFRGCKSLVDICDLDFSSATDEIYALFESCESMVEAPTMKNIKTSVKNISCLYQGCKKLKTIPDINAPGATSISALFKGCSVLEVIPTFTAGTSKVTDMSSLFAECISLSNVPELDTKNVTNMSNMFNGCIAITVLPLFDTSSVTIMSNMLANCTGLKEVPAFDTGNVVQMNYMLNGCRLITTIPLLNTSKVQFMNGMFRDCIAITSIPAISTSSLTNAQEMFRGCTSLTTVPSTIDVSKCTSVYCMYYGCTSLESTPLMNLGNISTSTYSMLVFYECNSLKSCSFSNIKSSFDLSNLSALTEVGFYDSYRNAAITVTNNASMTEDCINNMFETLNTLDRASIDISGNPGTWTCDVSIAQAKNWTVIQSY